MTLKDLKLAYDASPTACVILYPDAPNFTIAEVNKAFLNLTQLERATLVGKELFCAFPENPGGDELRRKKNIRTSLEHVQFLKRPHKIRLHRYDIKKPGSDHFEERFWNCDNYPILNEQGEIIYIAQNLVDVTNLVKANEHQNISNSRELTRKISQHPLFEDYPDAICTLDLKGNFLSANKVFIDIAESSLQELLKLSFMKFIAPADFQPVFNHFQQALKGKAQQFDVNFITAGANDKTLHINILPIHINSEIMGLYVVAKDITQNIAIANELQLQKDRDKRTREKINSILESIADGFFAVDNNWKITYWNKVLEKLFIVNREAVIDKNFYELFAGVLPVTFMSQLDRAFTENISIQFETFIPLLNIAAEVSLYPSKEGLSVYIKDINQLKIAKNEIEEATERYKSMFNFSPIPKWVYDIDTLRFLDVNEAALSNYQYTREEFLSMNIKEIVPKEDVAGLDDLFSEEQKPASNCKALRHIKKSGEIIYVNAKSNKIYFGGTNARIVSAIDITEKLKAENALLQSEKRFKALVQNGSDMIAILDETGNYTYVSPTSKSVLGIDAEAFIGKSAFEFMHPEDTTWVRDVFMQIRSQKRIQIPPFRFKNGDDKFRWIETIVTDMTDDPAVRGIVCNSKDVTDRIQNDIKLRNVIERHNIVSKATSDAIYDLDLKTRKAVWNNAIKGIFGHKLNTNFTFDWWYNNVHPDDAPHVVKNVQKLMKSRKSRWAEEYRFRCADDSYKFVFDRGFIIYDESNEPVRIIGAMQDITDRVNHIKAIEDQNKKLHEISWMQAHIVRAPLTRILALAGLLRSDQDVEVMGKMLDYLLLSANELDEVIKNIVDKSDEVY